MPFREQRCSRLITDAFAHYNPGFRANTRQAPLRFHTLDLQRDQRDPVERIEH